MGHSLLEPMVPDAKRRCDAPVVFYARCTLTSPDQNAHEARRSIATFSSFKMGIAVTKVSFVFFKMFLLLWSGGLGWSKSGVEPRCYDLHLFEWEMPRSKLIHRFKYIILTVLRCGNYSAASDVLGV